MRKGIYPYEYVHDCEKFNNGELLERKEFYNLNLEHILEEDYNHAKRIYRDFEIKNLGKCHDLYLRSDVLLLVDVFKNFRKILEIYYTRLNQTYTSPQPRMTGSFKKDPSRIETFN